MKIKRFINQLKYIVLWEWGICLIIHAPSKNGEMRWLEGFSKRQNGCKLDIGIYLLLDAIRPTLKPLGTS